MMIKECIFYAKEKHSKLYVVISIFRKLLIECGTMVCLLNCMIWV